VTGPNNDRPRTYAITVAGSIVLLSWLVVSLFAWSDIPEPHLRPARLVTAAACLATLLAVWSGRRTGSDWLPQCGYVAMLLPLLVVLWLTDEGRAAQHVPWEPFEVNKLAAIVVALLAPPAWLGFSSIALLIGTSLVHYYVLGPEPRPRMTAGEPWSTVEYGVVAVALLLYRLRALRIEAQLARSHAAEGALREIARTFLAVRDLANTPLQTLALLAALLRSERANPTRVADRIDRVVARMRELDAMLSRYDQSLPQEFFDLSFDARVRLERPPPPRRDDGD
jgi:hypothetical protein